MAELIAIALLQPCPRDLRRVRAVAPAQSAAVSQPDIADRRVYGIALREGSAQRLEEQYADTLADRGRFSADVVAARTRRCPPERQLGRSGTKDQVDPSAQRRFATT